MQLPRILLLTEAVPMKNRGGAKQTLYNLLKEYPQENLSLLTIKSDEVAPPDSMKSFLYRESYFDFLPSVIQTRFSYPLYQLNCIIRKTVGYDKINQIIDWKPDIILVVPMGSAPVWIGEELSRKVPAKVVVYMMDDWLEVQRPGPAKWATDRNLKHLLQISAGWIMISKNMSQTLKERYQLDNKKVLIAQNPVYLEAINLNPKPIVATNSFKLAYAGAILPMHADGVKLVAKAVSLLRKQGKDVTFTVFASDYYWSYWEQVWKKNGADMDGVIYGGYLERYADFLLQLQNYDLCVVSAAFNPKLAPYSRSSVQTKITDYWSTGAPILSVGPTYSACSQFVAEREAGFVIDKNDPAACAEFILKIMNNPELRKKYRDNGLRIVRDEFSMPIVTKQINEFFKDIHAS